MMNEIVCLWKAPTLEFAEEFALSGFNAKAFKLQPDIYDGKAYFAISESLAKGDAWCYGGGIIEVRMKRSDYVDHFMSFEQICMGTTEIEVAIPREKLEVFNRLTLQRIWHHD